MNKGSASRLSPCLIGGAKRDRTADLYNAIVALSQLSYGPMGRPADGRAAAGEARETSRRIQAKNTGKASSALVLVDLLDHLGHVGIILAQLGGVLDEVLLV